MRPHTFCSFCGTRFPEKFCGTRFPEKLSWPRTCPTCHHTTYRNPLPVAVVLVPVDGGGLLLARRSVEPQAGKLALPGGYINLGETWQEAGAREVAEETGVRVDPASIREFGVRSAPDGTVSIFGQSDPVERSAVDAFQVSSEAMECMIIHAPVDHLAFPLHAEMISAYFNR